MFHGTGAPCCVPMELKENLVLFTKLIWQRLRLSNLDLGSIIPVNHACRERPVDAQKLLLRRRRRRLHHQVDIHIPDLATVLQVGGNTCPQWKPVILGRGPYGVLLMRMGSACQKLVGRMILSERTAVGRIVLEVVQISPLRDPMRMRIRNRDLGVVLGFYGLDDYGLG